MLSQPESSRLPSPPWSSSRQGAVASINEFRKWCSKIDPEQIANSLAFLQLRIAPSTPEAPKGSKAGDATWIFPAEWSARGSLSTRSIAFDPVSNGVPFSAVVAPQTAVMVRQYAAALMVRDSRPLGLHSLANRVHMVTRFARTLSEAAIEHPAPPLSAFLFERVVKACEQLQDKWSKKSTDHALLRTVLEEIDEFSKAGILADSFGHLPMSALLGRISSESLTANLNELNSQRANQAHNHADPVETPPPISTLPFPIRYIEATLSIALKYVDNLAPHIVRHANALATIRENTTREKSHRVCKKVLGRNIAARYAEFAEREINGDAWRGTDGSMLVTPLIDDYVFPPRTMQDLIVLIASLQMACLQPIALFAASRLSEMHTMNPRGIEPFDSSGQVRAINGLIFKGAGPVGFIDHAWVMPEFACRCLEVQEQLFRNFREENSATLWCETRIGSLGRPMRSAEGIHLTTFARRHGLDRHPDSSSVSFRRFRKTFAKLAVMYAPHGVEIVRRQLGHKPAECGISNQTIDYIAADRMTIPEARLAANPNSYAIPEEIRTHVHGLFNSNHKGRIHE